MTFPLRVQVDVASPTVAVRAPVEGVDSALFHQRWACEAERGCRQWNAALVPLTGPTWTGGGVAVFAGGVYVRDEGLISVASALRSVDDAERVAAGVLSAVAWVRRRRWTFEDEVNATTERLPRD